jgi:hypothetical protein
LRQDAARCYISSVFRPHPVVEREELAREDVAREDVAREELEREQGG